MAKSLSQKTPYMNQLLCAIKADRIAEHEADLIEKYEAALIKDYKLSGKTERDILWMKHRNLRRLLDEIEKQLKLNARSLF